MKILFEKLKLMFARQPRLQQMAVSSSSYSQLKVGDEIELQMDENTVEKVTVVEITPHAEVKGSVYFTFSNGVVCRDIRLH